jgi:hypothetical protein
MPKPIEERFDDFEERVDKEFQEIRILINNSSRRVEVFINGEKDLGAKGVLERLMKMEEAYRQFEGLEKIFEWINKIIGWGKYILPLIGAAMAYTHYNFHGTNEIFHK